MRGPPRPQPIRHHSLDEVRRLLVAAGEAVASAEDAFRRRPGSAACAQRVFAAGQSLLLVRLVADCGARRGELAVLRLSDLDGRVLTIERSLSASVLGSTKSGRTRRVTLGSGTADMIRHHFRPGLPGWSQRRTGCSAHRQAVGPHDSWRPRPPANPPGVGLGRRARGFAPRPPQRGHLPGGPGVTPPPPCGTTRMPSRLMTPTWQTSLTVSSTAWTRGTPKRGSSCFTLCLTSLRTWTAAVTEGDAQPVRKPDLSRNGSLLHRGLGLNAAGLVSRRRDRGSGEAGQARGTLWLPGPA
jgi:hypothetical protein